MGKSFWMGCLVIAVLCVPSALIAQQDNVGYYEKVGQDGDNAIYELVWSTHVPGEDEIPLQSWEFPISLSSGGSTGGCDSDPLPGHELCFDTSESHDFAGSEDGLLEEEDPKELPDVVVTEATTSTRVLIRIASGASSGGGSGGGDDGEAGFGGGTNVPPSVPEPCDTDEWEEIDDDVVKQMMESPTILAKLWQMIQDSLPPVVEEGGRLVPIGTHGARRFDRLGEDFGTIHSQGPCHINFSANIMQPDGAYFVHTHPFSDGDPSPEGCEGDFYQSGPSPEDRQTLATYGFEKGIIFDKDVIIVYSADEPDKDPGQQEERCGY